MSTENINLMNKVYNSRAENGIHLTNKLNMGPLIRLRKQKKKRIVPIVGLTYLEFKLLQWFTQI